MLPNNYIAYVDRSGRIEFGTVCPIARIPIAWHQDFEAMVAAIKPKAKSDPLYPALMTVPGNIERMACEDAIEVVEKFGKTVRDELDLFDQVTKQAQGARPRSAEVA